MQIRWQKTQQAQAHDILICLQCYRAYFFHGETKRIELLSDTGYTLLLNFYTELFPITGTPERT